MATKKLGLEFFAKGAASFARDIAHINMGLVNYASTVSKMASSVQKANESQVKSWENANTKTAKSIEKMTNKIKELGTTGTSYTRQMRSISDTINVLKTSVDSATKNVNGWKEVLSSSVQGTNGYRIASEGLAKAQKDLAELTIELNKAQVSLDSKEEKRTNLRRKIAQLKDDIADATKRETRTSLELALAIAEEAKATQNAEKLANSWLSHFMKSPETFAKMTLALDVLSAAINAVSFAMQAIKATVNTVVGVFNFFKDTIKGVINFAKNLVSSIVNLGKTLINIAMTPLKLVNNAFQKLKDVLTNVFTIVIGMSTQRIIWGLGKAFRDLGLEVLGSAQNFQLLEVRLKGLLALEQVEMGFAKSVPDAFADMSDKARELFDWLTEISVISPFNNEDITRVFTLAKSYKYTTDEAKSLTASVVDFASGMGLGNSEMSRIIENFGQMVAAGKTTGMELRDLARGAFVPVNRVFDVMANKAKEASEELSGMTAKERELADPEDIKRLEQFAKLAGMTGSQLKEIGASGSFDVKLFTDAFQAMVETDFAGAAERTAVTMRTALSNIEDFMQAIIGFRVLKPILDVVAVRLKDVVDTLYTNEMKGATDNLGKLLSSATKFAFGLSDAFNKKLFGDVSIVGKIGTINTLLSNFVGIINLAKKPTKDLVETFIGKDGFHTIESAVDNTSKELMRFIVSIRSQLTALGFSETVINEIDNFTRGMFGIIHSLSSGEIGFIEAFKEIMTMTGNVVEVYWDEQLKPMINKKLRDIYENILKPKFDSFVELAREKLPGIGLFIISGLRDALEWIGTEFVPSVLDGFKSIFGVGDDSVIGEFIGAIKNISTILSGAIANRTPDEAAPLMRISQEQEIGEAKSGLLGLLDKLKQKAKELAEEWITKLKEKMGELWNSFKENNPQLDTTVQLLQDIIDKIGKIDQEKISNFVREIKKLAGAWEEMTSLADAVVALVKALTTFYSLEAKKFDLFKALFGIEKDDAADIIEKIQKLADVVDFYASVIEKISKIQSLMMPGNAMFSGLGGLFSGIKGLDGFGSEYEIGNALQGNVGENEIPGFGVLNAEAWDTNPVLEKIIGFVDGIIGEFIRLDEELVTHSVIPDMFEKILAEFDTKMLGITGIVSSALGFGGVAGVGGEGASEKGGAKTKGEEGGEGEEGAPTSVIGAFTSAFIKIIKIVDRDLMRTATLFSTYMIQIANKVDEQLEIIISYFTDTDFYSPAKDAMSELSKGAKEGLQPLIDTLNSIISKINFIMANTGGGGGGGGSSNVTKRTGSPVGLAKGGIALQGSPYIVGEKGPEMFFPNISGRVVPNTKSALLSRLVNSNYSRNISSSREVNYNYDIHANYSHQPYRSLKNDIRLLQMVNSV